MTTTDKTMFTAWDGATYANLGGLFDTVRELETNLDHEEQLRVAIWAWNNHEAINADTIAELIEQEQDAFQGEADSDADFTEEALTGAGYIPEDVPSWVVIDWEATWNSALRFDYFTYDVVDIDGAFRKFYWRAY